MPARNCKKRPLKRTDTLAIQHHLIEAERWRDLALLMTGVDSFLRSCDLLRLRVRHVQHAPYQISKEFVWQQRKNKRSVTCHLTEPTRQALVRWIRRSGK